MSNETETPLTDAHCGIREGDDPENFLCTVKFARDLERQLAESVSKRDVARAVFYNVDGVTNNPSWQKDKLKALGITPDMAKEGE